MSAYARARQDRSDRRGATGERAERYALIDTPVTLDGRPARIVGAACDYATVRNDIGQQGEWSWMAAARVVANGGDFRL